MHHFFRRIPEARWRETVRARSDISTLAMIFSLVFALSRQKTSIKCHEIERHTYFALLPAPCSPWQRSRFRGHFAGRKRRRRRDPPRGLGDADHHTKDRAVIFFCGTLIYLQLDHNLHHYRPFNSRWGFLWASLLVVWSSQQRCRFIPKTWCACFYNLSSRFLNGRLGFAGEKKLPTPVSTCPKW